MGCFEMSRGLMLRNGIDYQERPSSCPGVSRGEASNQQKQGLSAPVIDPNLGRVSDHDRSRRGKSLISKESYPDLISGGQSYEIAQAQEAPQSHHPGLENSTPADGKLSSGLSFYRKILSIRSHRRARYAVRTGAFFYQLNS